MSGVAELERLRQESESLRKEVASRAEEAAHWRAKAEGLGEKHAELTMLQNQVAYWQREAQRNSELAARAADLAAPLRRPGEDCKGRIDLDGLPEHSWAPEPEPERGAAPCAAAVRVCHAAKSLVAGQDEDVIDISGRTSPPPPVEVLQAPPRRSFNVNAPMGLS